MQDRANLHYWRIHKNEPCQQMPQPTILLSNCVLWLTIQEVLIADESVTICATIEKHLQPIGARVVPRTLSLRVSFSVFVPLASARLQLTVDRCLPRRPSVWSLASRLCRN